MIPLKYKKRKERPYAQKLIPIIIIAIMGYTILAFILQFKMGIEPSPTLTTAYFSFWGAEIIGLATIRTSKEKTKRTSQNIDLNDQNDDSVG